MDVTKPYEIIGLGAMDVTKPYKFIGIGAMDLTAVSYDDARGPRLCTCLACRAGLRRATCLPVCLPLCFVAPNPLNSQGLVTSVAPNPMNS